MMKELAMPKTILPRRWWLILTCVVILSGCSSLGIKAPWLPLPGQEEKPQQPTILIAMWSDVVTQQPNGEAARGFGGRLTFYAAKGAKPIRVDGSLVVYGFEEHDGVSTKVQPDQKYVFTPEQFATHYEKFDSGTVLHGVGPVGHGRGNAQGGQPDRPLHAQGRPTGDRRADAARSAGPAGPGIREAPDCGGLAAAGRATATCGRFPTIRPRPPAATTAPPPSRTAPGCRSPPSN